MSLAPLDDRHRAAAAVLERGGTRREAARAVGVSEKTVHGWLQRSDFRDLCPNRTGKGNRFQATPLRPPRAIALFRGRGDIASGRVIDEGAWYRRRGSSERFCTDCAVRYGGRHLPDCARAA